MERTNQFKLPVLPYVKKWLLRRFGLTDPIKVEEYSILGKAVMLALIDKRTNVELNKLSSYRGNSHKNRLTDTITLVLSQDMMLRSPRVNKLIRINIDLARHFKADLITWVDAQHSVGIPMNTSCKLFLDALRIEEGEYSLDAAFKHVTRNKNKRDNKPKKKKGKR